MKSTFICVAAALALVGYARAAELKQIATIPIPGERLTSWDISFIDQVGRRYFLADQSNRAIDIFDTRENKYIGRVTGFVGRATENGKPDRNRSGPDGVLAFADQVWAGDGDSTVKVVDVTTMKIVDTIATGGKTRLDEIAFDPKDEVFIGINNAEEPPFATLFSTRPGHKVIARTVLADATHGAEQPAYNPRDGMFYVAVPEIDKDPTRGGVAVIDPKNGKIVRMLSNERCRPNGLAFGPDQDFVLGCSANGRNGMAPVVLVMSAKTGATVAAIPDIGGADMVGYSAKNKQYYIGGAGMPGGGTLGVIDATTNTLVEKLALPGGGTPHSLAVDDNTGHIFVPSNAEGGGCNCVEVFSVQ